MSSHRRSNRSSRSHRNHQSSSRRSHGFSAHQFVNWILFVLYSLVMVAMLYTMYKYHFLGFRYVNVILTLVALAIWGLAGFFLLKKRKPVLTSVILTLFTILTGAIFLGFNSTVGFLGNLNESTKVKEVEMQILVPKDSDMTLESLDSVEAPTQTDGNNIDKLLQQVETEKNKKLSATHVDSYAKAYSDLTDGSAQAIVMSSAYAELLKNQDQDYDNKVKVIYKTTIQTATDVASKKLDSDAFNIYISGIDTYGPINSVSRSDVNIIMTVNLNTKKVLMTTTPRDAYVSIPDGGQNQKDKLTHAGIYGVETSMKTLENLYDTNIDYYARLNFTSFLKLVDVIGGIEVYNDQAFTAHTNKDYSFPKGNIKLDSKGALAFVRERYSLENGDNDRGKNQEKVIAAIINKLVSADSAFNANSIIEQLQGSIQTNMPIQDIMTIANSQLGTGANFQVDSQAVTGTGSTGQLKSFAMPDASLYMMELDDNSVAQAKTQINNVLGGN